MSFVRSEGEFDPGERGIFSKMQDGAGLAD
jgi:hypothetical protein